jgi:hypothetical protein
MGRGEGTSTEVRASPSIEIRQESIISREIDRHDMQVDRIGFPEIVETRHDTSIGLTVKDKFANSDEIDAPIMNYSDQAGYRLVVRFDWEQPEYAVTVKIPRQLVSGFEHLVTLAIITCLLYGYLVYHLIPAKYLEKDLDFILR